LLDNEHRWLKFSVLPGEFCVIQMPPKSNTPGWALTGSFISVTGTAEELSIVCESRNLPAELEVRELWTGLKLQGPFAFTETGVLASFLEPLARAGIPIFAVSTYDTDYVFVKVDTTKRAVKALESSGHTLIS